MHPLRALRGRGDNTSEHVADQLGPEYWSYCGTVPSTGPPTTEVTQP